MQFMMTQVICENAVSGNATRVRALRNDWGKLEKLLNGDLVFKNFLKSSFMEVWHFRNSTLKWKQYFQK